MDQKIRDIFDNYFSTRIRLLGKARRVGSIDQKSLLDDIPNLIRSYLQNWGVAHQYKVKASIGVGNIARVPWVGIFREEITENAENGYYIVLLFSENMGSCYLSLNQGITAVEKIYTKNFAARKMHEAALLALNSIECDPEAHLGKIDLAATGDLGRAYEAAAIVSFKYTASFLPDEQTFVHHLKLLLEYYETLFKKFGRSLSSLISITESEFQQVVLEKAAAQPLSHDDGIALDLKDVNGIGIKRSPSVAAEAIRSAQFTCEIDSEHWTFTSRAKKQKYVEAHHLILISQQGKFFVSLDVVENVVCLCATCHRMLHYGLEVEKKSILISLFKQRKKSLLTRSISVGMHDFLKFYSSEMLVED
jgi:5-methylcytosine-specific restriction protein A